MTSNPVSIGSAGSENLARYFFNVSDGETRSFPQCIDLPSAQDARREASKMACAALCEQSDLFWRTREWQLTVTDERGLNLFSLLILAAGEPGSNGR